jgi:hypothetical protein
VPAAGDDQTLKDPSPDVPPAADRRPAEPPLAAAEPPDDVDREAVARLLLRGEGAERNGNLAEALTHYRAVLKLNAGNAIALRAVLRIRVATLLRRAESLILAGDYDGAGKVLGEVEAYDLANTRVEELRDAIEQGRNNPTRKKPGVF